MISLIQKNGMKEDTEENIDGAFKYHRASFKREMEPRIRQQPNE